MIQKKEENGEKYEGDRGQRADRAARRRRSRLLSDQLEYTDSEGRSGRVNVEIATDHYSAKSIGAKAAAGFAVHGSNGRAAARVARSLGQDQGSGGGRGGGGKDKGSIEL